MTESARKNIGGTPIVNHSLNIVNIQHVEYLRSEILMCGGNSEDTTHYRSKTVKSRIFSPHVCGLTNTTTCTKHAHLSDSVQSRTQFSLLAFCALMVKYTQNCQSAILASIHVNAYVLSECKQLGENQMHDVSILVK